MLRLLIATSALLAGLHQPAHEAWVERGLPYVESRGNRWAISPVGARGLWQVRPRWSRVPGVLLHVWPLGTWEGRRVLRRWMQRCIKQERAELRACGQRCSRHASPSERGGNPRQGTDPGGEWLAADVRGLTPVGQSPASQRLVCALRAYNCGNKGLRGSCAGYADAVRAAGRRQVF